MPSPEGRREVYVRNLVILSFADRVGLNYEPRNGPLATLLVANEPKPKEERLGSGEVRHGIDHTLITARWRGEVGLRGLISEFAFVFLSRFISGYTALSEEVELGEKREM